MEPSQQHLFSALWVLFCSVPCRRRTRCVRAYVQTKQAEEEITPNRNSTLQGDAPQSIQVWKHQDVAG